MEKDILSFSRTKNALTAHICCEIDHHTARILRAEIDRMLFLNKPELLIMDFTSVRFMDSSGIGLILGRLDRAESIGASLRIVGLNPTLMKLVRLSGIERMKSISVSRNA